MSFSITERDGGICFDIIVAPRASREKIGPLVGDRLKIAITAPPVDGQANAAVIALLAKQLRVRKQDIQIRAGETGKRKTIFIFGISAAEFRGRCQVC